MKIYYGDRAKGPRRIFVKDGDKVKTLNILRSLKIISHSPTGFEWGYGGSGPAQTALAILLDHSNNSALSQRLHQQFKWDFVTRWKGSWQVTSEQIEEWIKGKENVS